MRRRRGQPPSRAVEADAPERPVRVGEREVVADRLRLDDDRAAPVSEPHARPAAGTSTGGFQSGAEATRSRLLFVAKRSPAGDQSTTPSGPGAPAGIRSYDSRTTRIRCRAPVRLSRTTIACAPCEPERVATISADFVPSGERSAPGGRVAGTRKTRSRHVARS